MGKHIWLWLLSLVIAAAFFPLFIGQFPAFGDMRDVFIPLENFFHQELLAGRLPAWQPDIAWGYPVIASAQIGFFYPLLLIARILPLSFYLPLILLGHLVAMGFGTFLFFRQQKCSTAASYLGALSFVLGSFIIQHVSHLNVIITAAWLPWQLWLIHRITQQASIKPNHMAKLAIILAMPFLAGQLHIPTLLMIVTSAYWLYRSVNNNRGYTKPIAVLLLVGPMVLLLASVQLLPTAELLLQSSRGPSGDFSIATANQHSFPLYHLPTMLFPRFYDNDSNYWGKRLQIEYGIFIGTIPLILALWHMSRRGLSRQNFFWIALLVISFLLALGALSPFRLIGLEPSLWIFSAPARWLLFTTFALSFFAARGLDDLPNYSKSLHRFTTIVAAIITFIVISSTIVLFTIKNSTINSAANILLADNLKRSPKYYNEKINNLLQSARQSSASLASPYSALPLILLVSLPLIITRSKFRKVILTATSAELIIIAAATNPMVPWSRITTPPDTIAALPADVKSGQARLISIREGGDTGQYFTNPDTRADAARRESYRQLLIPLGHTIFNIPGIEWPASLSLAGHANFIDQIRTADQFQVNEKLAASANIAALLIPINASPTNNSPSRRTVADTTIIHLQPHPRASVDGAAAIYQTISPTNILITTNSPKPTTLIVRDSFYPGWHAFINQQEIPITRYDSIFRQIAIPPGRHTINLKYQPLSIYVGAGLSALTLVLCLGIIYKKRI